jgi:hypothetical protein
MPCVYNNLGWTAEQGLIRAFALKGVTGQWSASRLIKMGFAVRSKSRAPKHFARIELTQAGLEYLYERFSVRQLQGLSEALTKEHEYVRAHYQT